MMSTSQLGGFSPTEKEDRSSSDNAPINFSDLLEENKSSVDEQKLKNVIYYTVITL